MRIAPSEITPESVYLDRRRLLTGGAALLAGGLARADDDKPTSWDVITSYNNFYEYSPDKHAVAELAKNLRPRPWAVTIEGEVARPRTLDVDELAREFGVQQRIYRLRCVEGWSMVIPWDGFPLAELLKQAQPTSRARYVKFVTLHDPARFYGQRRPTLPWPYTEGLTIAEAMHPLTLLATGLYGKALPPQNGAPLRLVVPWKYGYKSIKSIVAIRLQEEQPATTWAQAAPGDYGFWANVNPRVALARGTQSRENRVGELRKRETLLFNGYAEQVAHLYAGMDVDKLR
ncbi:protein-methionine-sulfoxide reductase catalytic subunit MsrP [Aquincola sp. S2]|uniref:Protein-methionine-sulfoxide reductase catalytic subunit MsrP n=1 Tax=Pseudaquabacterium terrae TaxID=2732868 RepID=A0ABX2EIM6_9BURK|nr:protein-methionine-sulfoxide reductase catalytic subunit MsrP [Aquabacterium terrae]NRF68468.1 protein-methionine-sulfoxide reductase catalytic subunit MsrP [Aquabacterium terrae]